MVIKAKDLFVKRGSKPVLQALSFSVQGGIALAVTGPSGSGKTTLLETLAGYHFHSGSLQFASGLKIAYVAQQHQFRNLSHTQTFYYQQRFNSFDADDSVTVAQELHALFGPANEQPDRYVDVRRMFGIDELANRRLLHLSNGENKRVQLAKSLLQTPDLLLLDNPFIGLDTVARTKLETCLAQLLHQGISIVLTCTAMRVPAFVQQVLVLDETGAGVLYAASAFKGVVQKQPEKNLDPDLLPAIFKTSQRTNWGEMIRMVDVHVQYGGKQILQQVTWRVGPDECWSLSGPNGAGKSTLLSLITADNPQAYANEIYLFGKRRGTGESIWDIKRNIGYVSPELHLYFDRSATVFDTIASGFFDTIGLFRILSKSQAQQVGDWIAFLGMTNGANWQLAQLPLGTQRLVLLARALVKNPPLLVLDEPLQGLDEDQAIFFRSVVDAISGHGDHSLIFVSHYPEDLPRCIDHYLRLENGRVV